MDPEQKMVAAIVAGAAAVATSAVKDAYQGLKQLISGRLKSKGGIEHAIEGVEQKPDSETRKRVLAEEIDDSGAAADSEILARVEELLALAEQEGLIERQRDGITVKVEQSGSGAVAIGNHSIAGGKGSVIVSGDVHGDVSTGSGGKP